ncbi:DNA/RNA non-specific endonuclease [Sinorhizobium meliloti]|nr:DNA/RNA non-specific endonuclease [Sinorhizobium meliloti]
MHISKQGAAQRTKLSIFNGPIFGDQDKPLHDAAVPLSFYKIVIWWDGNDQPGAAGFMLDQSDLIEALPEEAIDAGKFAVRHRPIAKIEQALDIDFGQIKGMGSLRRSYRRRSGGRGRGNHPGLWRHSSLGRSALCSVWQNFR